MAEKNIPINIFKRYLQPYLIDGCNLVRIGCENDGGYVIPESMIYLCTKLISVGIGSDISFEKNLLELNNRIKIYCFDHVIAALPECDFKYTENFVHYRNGLGFGKNNLIDINSAYRLCDLRNEDVVIFKMDAEGAEWNCGIDTFDFSNTACIVLELHSLIRKYKYEYYAACLDSLCKNHICVHVHGNNACGMFEFEGLHYPGMMEATFIHKKFIEDRQCIISPFGSPRKIDQSNVKQNREVAFKYW